MNKSLIALAVAGAFAAPAFAASSNVDVYGTLRYSLDHVDVKAADSDKWQITDETSRFGIKGSEDLGGGLKAVWQIEQQISSTGGPLDNASGAGAGYTNTSTSTTTTTVHYANTVMMPNGVACAVAAGCDFATTSATTTATTTAGDGPFGNAGLRNTFIGLAGGFGTVIIGRHDTPYKLGGSADVFADTAADSQRNGAGGIIGRNGFDNRVSGTIAYISPDWSGFHFALATVPGEVAGVNTADGLMDAYSMVAVYANGPLKATLGHEVFTKELAGGAQNAKGTKFNIGYKIGDVGLGYTYERSDDGFAATSETDTGHLASVTYGMGPITLAGQYGKFNNKQAYTGLAGGILGKTTAGSDDDLTRWTVGAIYSLSKRTNVYAAYNSDNYKDDTVANDTKVWTFGVNTTF